MLPRGARVRRRRRGRRAPGPMPARWRSECGGSGRQYRVNERGTARGFGRRGSAGGLEMSRGVESTRTSAGMADGGSVAGAAAGAPAAGAAGLPGPVSAAGTAAGAPPGSATGSFRASLIVPCRGNYEAGLSARPTRMSASALGRARVPRARGRIRRLRPRLAPYGGACWCARGAGAPSCGRPRRARGLSAVESGRENENGRLAQLGLLVSMTQT